VCQFGDVELHGQHSERTVTAVTQIKWLQQIGVKRSGPKWQAVFGTQRLYERCIVAMVGDGINDALVSRNPPVLVGRFSDCFFND
jgi:hypothetical protein